ncbi:MAG TPA: GGDEF domain-containing protein [Burkholderiaceae bacterium]|nr:GGDEF domain-containing protein [Burkholderiaceae bacterium]
MLPAAAAEPAEAAGGLAAQRGLLAFAACFAACWRGDFAGAREHARRISPGSHGGQQPAWLDALATWASCEWALVQGDWPAAEASVRRMIEVALLAEHEQVARTGYMLASGILDAQGRSREALDALRLLAQRDIAIRRESLEHHERVAKWQLELRDSSIRMRRLEARSRRLERLSLEDPLTGLPNRRHFERELASLLRPGQQLAEPLSIALIDVDRFKEINDLHSHVLGDRVLKALADLIGAQVRQGDLPARLGGDEFVVLFRRAGVGVAAAACERLKAAVSRYPWHELVPGMAVTVSIGLAESVAGDTIESLLRRSDDDMYRAKASRG